MDAVREFLEYEIFRIGEHSLQVYTILYILLTILITKLLIWFLKYIIVRSEKFDTFDQGNIFALLQIFSYIIWVIAFSIILESVGVKMSMLLAGSAALLVGIGLGLQQTFNDIVSGIILLFEGSTKVGDVLEIDSEIIKIQTIGLRTSKGISRDDIIIIIPNSQITTSKVINWSHQSRKTRFHVLVHVSLDSDIELVMNVLKQSVKEHPQIKASDIVEPRFLHFGESSLQFQVFFYSNQNFRIERIKGDIRVNIFRNFIKNNITIPFPQVDLHFKSNTFDVNKSLDN